MFGQINQKAKEANVEAAEERDSLGGSLLEGGVYPFEFDTVYFTQSESGAMAFNAILKIDGTTKRDTVYFTNRNGEIHYEKDGENFPLPGWNAFTAFCKLYIGKDPATFDDNTTVELTLDLWDKDQQKEVPTTVKAIKEFTGVKGMVGISKVKVNKTKKNETTGKYDNLNEAQVVNEFDKYFSEKGLTLKEIGAGKTEPAFLEEWKTKFEGQEIDRFKEVKGAASKGNKAAAFRKGKSGGAAAPKSSDVAEDEADDGLFD